MTIERAIKHAKLVASEQMMRSGKCVQEDKNCDKFSSCLKCAEEHEQLAQWLEELKEYKKLEEKLCVMFAGDCSLSDVVENLERQIAEPDRDHPVNARILTYEDAEKWNEYLKLEEQGLLVRLPCKVGDTVYRVNAGVKQPIIPMTVSEIHFLCYKNERAIRFDAIGKEDMGESCYRLEDIGRIVFLDREEAEKKLEEMKWEHDAGRNHY